MNIVKFKGEPKTYKLPDDIFFTKEDISHFNGDLIIRYYSEVFTTPAYLWCQVPRWDLANAKNYAENCYKAWIKHVEECLYTGKLKINKELWLKNIGLKQPHSETIA